MLFFTEKRPDLNSEEKITPEEKLGLNVEYMKNNIYINDFKF